MTSVEITREGKRWIITAKGHADDIEACNYITGVLYSLAGFAANEEERGRAKLLHLEMSPGDVTIDARGGVRLAAAYEMACIGLLQLQEARPRAISVKGNGK